MQKGFMEKAIEIAKTSGEDIPVGAVIVSGNKIISTGVNNRERAQNSIGHAEIIAIQEANRILKKWRLDDCEMYVTLEPCPMCASAILQSRIKKIYFGAYDLLNGAMGSRTDMKEVMGLDIEAVGGIMEEECKEVLKKYFEKIRK